MITPIIREIKNNIRLRGIDIQKGWRGVPYWPHLILPLIVRLIKGSDYLAESLLLRNHYLTCQKCSTMLNKEVPSSKEKI